MKLLCSLLAAALLAGCAGTHPKGVSRYDEYDAVKVDQMVGNCFSGRVFGKTVVCLNARRETREITAVTNVIVRTMTNQTVIAVTNLTTSIATNHLVTTMTNLAPLPALLPATGQPSGEPPPASAAETNLLLAVANPGLTVTTNVTVATASNQSASTAPNQTIVNHQAVRSFNNQITTTSNNVSVSVMTNQNVIAETNQVVSYLTNHAVLSVTNVVISPTNDFAHDYFLYSELIPPPEFTLQSGESLVLLVDGVRHGFSQSPTGSSFVGRAGFVSSLYRVPPEVLVAIANAQEVKVRFRGVNNVLERIMSEGSKQNFRAFLLKYFGPEPATAAPSTAWKPGQWKVVSR